MNFAGEVLQNVDGIQYYYITGILLFLALFIVIVYRTVRIPRKDLEDFKTSIFDNDELKTKKTKHKSEPHSPK